MGQLTPVPPQAAVAIGNLREILLVVGFGVVERRRLANLRSDGPEARGPKGRFEGRLRGLRCRQLGVRCAIDR